MDSLSNPWIKFWNEQHVFPPVFLEKNMRIFYAESNRILSYDQNDVILDIGCGPGLLEDFLLPVVKRIVALDTSANFIHENNDRFNAPDRLTFIQLGDEYTDLSFMPEATFTKVICLSVVQYYRSVNEIITLIDQTRRLVQPAGKMLIADIPVTTSIFNDLINLIKTAFRERMMIATLGFLFRARLGAYHQMQNQQGLLRLSATDLRKVCDAVPDDTQILHQRMSLNPNRTHLLISFGQ
jgi:2-polyprenyl-3-methyl-5-hydroxy-6-metoxy-1,4-benzoquinol methylase